MSNTIARRIATALTGSALAAGILAGGVGLSATAQASPTDAGASTCSMAMPNTTAPVAGAPNMITRAGVIGMLSPTTPGKNSAMDAACSAS